ncbi:MAG: transglycosylase SLT domain-containing protein [Brevundimonas sp.]|uniref:lytic transglycosylase domain-containing protein n=1 Tax=Brevundimonas sp. TaxID=1871086 RepID=UPI00391A14C6
MTSRRARSIILTGLAGALAACLLSSPVLAQSGFPRLPSALSPSDRLSYTTAFDALRRGQIDRARAEASRLQDHTLLGRLEFERLFHPSYTASFEELSDWLNAYADLPMATRVYNLAMRRRPEGAPEPRRPGGTPLLRTWADINAASPEQAMPEPPGPRDARMALNDGDLDRAFMLGSLTADWWVAGLAAWRQRNYAEALNAFERVATDPTQDIWVRSGGAYWTARALQQLGQGERETEFLRLAARWPATFYGQIALHRLGETPVIENLGPTSYADILAAEDRSRAAVSLPPDLDYDALEVFVRDDARARRVVAYVELDDLAEAREELRLGLRNAETAPAREMWRQLAEALGPRVTGNATGRIRAGDYPVPLLEPDGGFTVERALVYAIVRKESRFDPSARSHAGAYGIMQVLPTTAAEITGDVGLARNPERLLDPATSLRVGQIYLQRMLQLPSFEGDILRAIVSYNGGPGRVISTLRQLDADADALLIIESIPVAETRQYVEEVMAAYWIYQRIFGGPLNTLDAIASGARTVPLSLDYRPPEPAPVLADSAGAPAEGTP